jgi:hypothetical protein
MSMSTLDFKVADLDFPVGSKNKTATLITGETDAFLIDTGFTRPVADVVAAEGLRSLSEPLAEPIPAPVPAG